MVNGGWPDRQLQSVAKHLWACKVGFLHQRSGWLAPWRVLPLRLSVAGLILSYLQRRGCYLDVLSCSSLNQVHALPQGLHVVALVLLSLHHWPPAAAHDLLLVQKLPHQSCEYNSAGGTAPTRCACGP